MVIFGYAYHTNTHTSIYKFTWAYAIDNAYHSYLVCQTDIALLYSNDNDNDSHYYSRGGGVLIFSAMYMYPPRYKKVGFGKVPPNYFNIKGKKDLTFIKKYDIIKTFLIP